MHVIESSQLQVITIQQQVLFQEILQLVVLLNVIQPFQLRQAARHLHMAVAQFQLIRIVCLMRIKLV